MVETAERPEVRISIRVDPDLLSGVQRIADERYEGRLSMAVREGLRRFVCEEVDELFDPEPPVEDAA